ncbi:MAG TPA: efflux RND transporter periplasmic adaptor subunit [Allosphingosinicella sp.]|jgi:RND family efflux transporter MFP subunit
MNFESPKWGRGALSVETVDDEAARTRRRRTIVIALVAAIVLLVLALFLVGGRKQPAGPAAAGAQTQGATPTVTIIVPGRQQVARVINATGTIAARRDMPVGISGEGGRVVKVLVEPGQWVAAGQSLAVIERSVQTQQAAQQAAQIEVARADARLQQSNLERAQALVARGFISKAELEDKRATRDAALARVKLAEAQLGETRARIGQLDVRAPTAGLILTRSVEVGQVVGSGSGALFRMADGGMMEVQARLTEEDLVNIHVGSPATVTPVGTAIHVKGGVWQVSPVVDPNSRQGIARIAVAYQAALRPGGFASVSLTGGAADLPLLPQAAVQSDDDGNFVYIVGPDNRVRRRNVKIGEVNDSGVSIASGLDGTERVVASAGAFLNPGDKVIPVHAAAHP